MMKKTLGIIGGMGPLATCDLMEKIIALTKAGKDQDNIHIVVDCNTNIPDRTAAIVGQGESPTCAQRHQAAGNGGGCPGNVL